jgi:dihydropteridine reductase
MNLVSGKNCNVAVIGGAGSLGRVLVQQLKSFGATVTSIDMQRNVDAPKNVIITAKGEENGASLQRACKEATLKEDGNAERYDAIYCVAGGWIGGNVSQSDSFLTSVTRMTQMNLTGAALAAAIAGTSLQPNGLLVLTSAKASLGPTPGMIAYGMTKAATNHLLSSLSSPGSGLPATATIIAILPETLDTESNRKAMPDANHGNWTPLADVASKLVSWMAPGVDRPQSGSLITVITRNGKTVFAPVQ